MTQQKRPLKVGLFLPFAEGMMDGATPRWADLQGMAQCAEAIGFDSIAFAPVLELLDMI